MAGKGDVRRQRTFRGAVSAIPIGQRGTGTVLLIVVRENTRPGLGDVEERLEEVGEIAVGSKGRKGIAERVEASLEFRAVLRVEGVEPAAAGEEPVARVAGSESSVSDQHDKIFRI